MAFAEAVEKKADTPEPAEVIEHYEGNKEKEKTRKRYTRQ